MCLCVYRGWTEGMEGCKHTRHVDSVGEGGAFRAARTTWTPDRTGGGGGSGIPSLRRRRISLRRQSPTPMPTTHSVAVDSHIRTHRQRRRSRVSPADTLVRTPESIIFASAADEGPPPEDADFSHGPATGDHKAAAGLLLLVLLVHDRSRR